MANFTGNVNGEKKSILLGIPRTLDNKTTTANSSREIKDGREPKKPIEWLKNLCENPIFLKKNERKVTKEKSKQVSQDYRAGVREWKLSA